MRREEDLVGQLLAVGMMSDEVQLLVLFHLDLELTSREDVRNYSLVNRLWRDEIKAARAASLPLQLYSTEPEHFEKVVVTAHQDHVTVQINVECYVELEGQICSIQTDMDWSWSRKKTLWRNMRCDVEKVHVCSMRASLCRLKQIAAFWGFKLLLFVDSREQRDEIAALYGRSKDVKFVCVTRPGIHRWNCE